MYFYLLHTPEWTDLQSGKKLGITGCPKRRYNDYKTEDSRKKFYSIAKFPDDTTIEQLRHIERIILISTIKYKIPNSEPTHEARCGITTEELWKLCTMYFPDGTVILTHQEALVLPIEDYIKDKIYRKEKKKKPLFDLDNIIKFSGIESKSEAINEQLRYVEPESKPESKPKSKLDIANEQVGKIEPNRSSKSLRSYQIECINKTIDVSCLSVLYPHFSQTNI